MKYQTAPIGTHSYDENLYSKEEAWDIIVNALNTNEIIVCKVISYEKESGELKISFHGNEGSIRRDHISFNRYMGVDYFIGKVVGVHVEKIYQFKRIFGATRLVVENLAKEELAKFQVGDIVEGIVQRVVDNYECAFVDLKEGHSAYLNLKQTTYIPNTVCTISEFLKEGTKIKAKVIYVPQNSTGRRRKDNIRISLIELEGKFEDRCKEYRLNSTKEGFVREDRMINGIYYIVINQYVYIRFKSDNPINPKNPVKVVLKNYNYEENCIEADPVGMDVPRPKNKRPEIIGYGCSMFQLKAKGTISPFAIRENEEWRIETEFVSGMSMDSIQNKYKIGHLNDVHSCILKIIGILGFCTSKQILSYAYSHKINLELTMQNKLSIRIESLLKAGLIDSRRFETEYEKGVYRIFNITKLGNQFLTNYLRQKKVTFSDGMYLFSPFEIKRILAVNQFVLACMEKIPSFQEFYYQQYIFGTNDIPIKTNGIVVFQTCAFFMEAVRRKQNFLSELEGKVERYQKFFGSSNFINRNRKNPNFVKDRRLYLIFVCEDFKQVMEIQSIINAKVFSDYVFFTHDLQIFQGDFEFSIYRINEKCQPQYYSIFDLITNGRECYTEEVVLDNNISYHKFNSFPEVWLQEKKSIWDELILEKIDIEDPNQNIKYLYQKEYESFLESSKLARNSMDSEILWEPRLFFWGSGGAGKTSLIKLLAGQPFNSEEEKTYGVRFFPNLFKNLPWMKVGEKKIENIQVWDFAGQGCDHVLTNFLMTDAALCIIVIDSRKEEYPDEWLKYIQMYAPNAKILLVLNKMDSENTVVQGEEQRNCSNLDLASYIRVYKNIAGIYKVSCKYPEKYDHDLINLENDICKHLLSMESQFTDVWVRGIKSLRDWICSSKDGFIYKRTFIDKHKELGLDKVNVESTLNLCVKAGICIYRKHMGNRIVLKPEWLTSALTKILRSDSFSQKKWQLTRNEVIDILEGPGYEDIYKYEEGEGEDLLELMERLDICTSSGDKFIFPCFLPYRSDSKSVDQIIESGNWYELEVRYQYLPPDIFPKLQVKLWNTQWNILFDEEKDYEPDKGKIVFVLNNRKMMAYTHKDSIVLALEKNQTEKRNLDNEGREAIKRLRQILKDINIEQKLELENSRSKNDKLQEYVVLTSTACSTEKKKLFYAKSNLKKICLKGFKERYFPDIDSFYDPTELLLEEFTIDKVKQIYSKYVVSIYSDSLEDETYEDFESKLLGSGFLFLYKEKWYVVCSAHELEMTCGKAYSVQIQSLRFGITYIKSEYKQKDMDVALFEVEEKFYKYSNLIPEEFLSFQMKIKKEDELYCCSYNSGNSLIDVDKMYFNVMDTTTNNLIVLLKHKENVIKGMSGSPILNLENRCIVGMLIGVENDYAIVMNIERIWKFIKKNIRE